MVSNKSIKIFVNWFLGPLLLVWLSYSLYKEIKTQPNLAESIHLLKAAPFGEHALIFWMVIVLVFVNWGLEARKWQLLMNDVQRMNFLTAFKSVLCGVTLSLNTPNRIGEYGGRILFVNDGNRLKAVTLSIAGSISQLIITLLLGTGGMFFILFQLPADSATVPYFTPFLIKFLLYLNTCLVLLFLLFFFRLSWIVRIIEKIPAFSKLAKYVSVLENFHANILLRLLVISFMRYIVFVIQYIFMMHLLNVGIAWWQSFWILSLLFWVLAIVPSFAIAEIGIRGKFGLALLGLFSNNKTGIVAVMFSIWLFNLFIPAVTGGLLIISKKYFKQK